MLRLDLLQGGGARPARTATVISVDAETAALTELRQALSRDPREIPCKYLYDDRGSALFEQITGLPEYYPTRTERALLVAQAEAIVDAAGGARLAEMVELGSGVAVGVDEALAVGPEAVTVSASGSAAPPTKLASPA